MIVKKGVVITREVVQETEFRPHKENWRYCDGELWRLVVRLKARRVSCISVFTVCRFLGLKYSLHFRPRANRNDSIKGT